MRVREHVEGGVQAQALELFAELLDELVEQYLEALGEEGDGALYDSFRKYGRLVLREGWGTLPSFAEWVKWEVLGAPYAGGPLSDLPRARVGEQERQRRNDELGNCR